MSNLSTAAPIIGTRDLEQLEPFPWRVKACLMLKLGFSIYVLINLPRAPSSVPSHSPTTERHPVANNSRTRQSQIGSRQSGRVRVRRKESFLPRTPVPHKLSQWTRNVAVTTGHFLRQILDLVLTCLLSSKAFPHFNSPIVSFSG